MKKNRTIHGIDLTAPGGLEALFAYRRAQFGDAQMNANGGDAGDGGQQGGQGEQGQQQAGANDAGAGQQEQQQQGDKAGDKAGEQGQAKAAEWDGKIESLPPAAQKLITDLRKADGDERVAKKTLDAIIKAINPDAKGDEKPTAEQLTQALNAGKAETVEARRELAIYKTANKLGADADALLDSRAFLAKVADLDPAKTADIETAIKDAVKDNPKLKLVRAAGTSGADFTGGSGEGAKKAASLEDAITSKMATR